MTLIPETNEITAARGTRPHGWLLTTMALIVVGSVILVGFAYVRYGSLAVALNTLRGEPLVPDAYSVSLGRMEQGESRQAAFRITNHSTRPIRLLGARCSCTCLLADALPVTVAPGESVPFRVTARGSKAGTFTEIVRIFTDCDALPSLVLRVGGDVPPGVSEAKS